MTEWIEMGLIQPGDVPSQNEVDRALHMGWSWKYDQWKSDWQAAGFYAWKEHRFNLPWTGLLGTPCDVKLDLGFRQNRRRDPHNYVGTVTKWVIDGLVRAGLWPDDNPEWVTVHQPVLTVHKGVSKNAPLPAAVLLKPRSENADEGTL